MQLSETTEAIIGAAIEVHRELGPGLLESAYDRLDATHEAQLVSYLKLSGCKVGLLLNFNVRVWRDGIKRMVYQYRPES